MTKTRRVLKSDGSYAEISLETPKVENTVIPLETPEVVTEVVSKKKASKKKATKKKVVKKVVETNDL